MLYDKKWDTKTEPAVLSIEGLITWLEKQPPDIRYDWKNCRGECLIGRYLEAVTGTYKHIFFSDVFKGQGLRHDAYGEVACEKPWTYGAALRRAREVAAR